MQTSDLRWTLRLLEPLGADLSSLWLEVFLDQALGRRHWDAGPSSVRISGFNILRFNRSIWVLISQVSFCAKELCSQLAEIIIDVLRL